MREVPELRFHGSNSATTLCMQETIFNAVRMGDAVWDIIQVERSWTCPMIWHSHLSLESAPGSCQDSSMRSLHGLWGDPIRRIVNKSLRQCQSVMQMVQDCDMQNFSVLGRWPRICPIGRVSMDQITIRLPKVYPLGIKSNWSAQTVTKKITATQVAYRWNH